MFESEEKLKAIFYAAGEDSLWDELIALLAESRPNFQEADFFNLLNILSLNTVDIYSLARIIKTVCMYPVVKQE